MILSILGDPPAPLVPHTILTAASVFGIFGQVNGVVFGSGHRLAVTYDPTAVIVTAALAGDANLDGAVDFSDLLILAQNYGMAAGATYSRGDFDGDGQTVFSDLLALAQNYGHSGLLDANNPTLTASFKADWAFAQALVPEPGSLLMLGGLMAGVPRARRASR